MDVIDISLAAKKAISQLEESGKIGKTKILSRQKRTPFATEFNEELDGLCVDMIEGTLGLKETDKEVLFYYLGTDGKFYNISGLGVRVPVTSPLVHGNLALGGMGDDTGEFFLIIIDFEQNTSLIVSKSVWDGELETNAYYVAVDTTIDPKFIPGAVLPVVKLITEPSEGGAQLNGQESAMIDELSKKHMPIIVSFLGSRPMTAVFNSLSFVSFCEFTARTTEGDFAIKNSGGYWMFHKGDDANG